MLKWVLGLLLVLGLLGGGTAIGLYYYVEQNANVAGTSAAAAFERVTEKKLKATCASFLESYPDPEQMNTDVQYKITCDCYADSMFEKLRDVPPDQVDAFMQRPENNKKAQVILVKCADQAGFN